jgi:hypothetical protein
VRGRRPCDGALGLPFSSQGCACLGSSSLLSMCTKAMVRLPLSLWFSSDWSWCASKGSPLGSGVGGSLGTGCRCRSAWRLQTTHASLDVRRVCGITARLQSEARTKEDSCAARDLEMVPCTHDKGDMLRSGYRGECRPMRELPLLSWTATAHSAQGPSRSPFVCRQEARTMHICFGQSNSKHSTNIQISSNISLTFGKCKIMRNEL